MLLNPAQTRLLFEQALENRSAILAVNADSPAAIRDCLEAALAADAPLIIETSLWQLKGFSYGHGDAHLGMAKYIAELSVLANSERFAKVPVVYHTDHIKGPGTAELLKQAIEGFSVDFGGLSARLRASSISVDSSEMTEEENIAMLCELCQHAEELGEDTTLEMEAGVDDGVTELQTAEKLLGAVESEHPGRLALWAPGVGTQHGLGEGATSGFSPEAITAQMEKACEITGRKVGIALHGSSGLSDEELAAGVAAGVVKVNWSSESLLIRSQAARSYYITDGDKLERGAEGFKNAAMDNGVQAHVSNSYRPRVENRIRTLNGSGLASRFLAQLAEPAGV